MELNHATLTLIAKMQSNNKKYNTIHKSTLEKLFKNYNFATLKFTKTKKMKPQKTQEQQVLEHLQSGHKISVLECVQKFNCVDLRKIISTLRKTYPIKDYWTKLPNGKSHKVYYIMTESNSTLPSAEDFFAAIKTITDTYKPAKVFGEIELEMQKRQFPLF